MARPSNSAARGVLLRTAGRASLVAVLLAAWTVSCRSLAACPFCTALGPTLAQRREQAAVVALVEVASPPDDQPTRLMIHRVLKGTERIGQREGLALPLDVRARPGDLLVVFGDGGGDASVADLSWYAVPVDETSFAYFARSPTLRTPSYERLGYFARYLEHPDPLVAQDAYLEFGHAPFDEVARVADRLPADSIRNWLVDPGVPQSRKGFYGLAVALATPADERAAAAEFLRRLIVEPRDDFRAGFDGILGGYLLLAPQPALALIQSRILANPRSADGDVRHALTALRFYDEYGEELTARQISQALAELLHREEFADAAIADLARLEAWDVLHAVVDVYTRSTSNSRARRAVVGYLLACPQPGAQAALDRLRNLDPRGIAAAEQVLSATTGIPAGE